MKRKIAALFVALFVALGIGVGTAAPASAHSYSGYCGHGYKLTFWPQDSVTFVRQYNQYGWHWHVNRHVDIFLREHYETIQCGPA